MNRSAPETLSDEPLSNEALALRAAEGCLGSFEQLVARFQVPLVRFLLQRTGSTEDAEDLTQETMVRAYQNLHRYRPKWRFSTWLFTIAWRLSVNARRHQAVRTPAGRQQPAEILVTVPSSTDAPEQAMIEQEQRQRFWQRVRTVLSEPKATALWLFYVEDMPVADIAQVLGRSRVAVKTLMFRARKELLPIFEDELREDMTWTAPTSFADDSRPRKETNESPSRELVREGGGT